jgi:hypothetical protein
MSFSEEDFIAATENRAFHAAMNTSFVPKEELIGCKIPEVQFTVW